MTDYCKTIELKSLSQTNNTTTTCFVTSTYNDTLNYKYTNILDDQSQVYQDDIDPKHIFLFDVDSYGSLVTMNMRYITNVLLSSINEDYGIIPFCVDLLDDNDYTFYTTYLSLIKPQQRIQNTTTILHNLIHFYLRLYYQRANKELINLKLDSQINPRQLLVPLISELEQIKHAYSAILDPFCFEQNNQFAEQDSISGQMVLVECYQFMNRIYQYHLIYIISKRINNIIYKNPVTDTADVRYQLPNSSIQLNHIYILGIMLLQCTKDQALIENIDTLFGMTPTITPDSSQLFENITLIEQKHAQWFVTYYQKTHQFDYCIENFDFSAIRKLYLPLYKLLKPKTNDVYLNPNNNAAYEAIISHFAKVINFHIDMLTRMDIYQTQSERFNPNKTTKNRYLTTLLLLLNHYESVVDKVKGYILSRQKLQSYLPDLSESLYNISLIDPTTADSICEANNILLNLLGKQIQKNYSTEYLTRIKRSLLERWYPSANYHTLNNIPLLSLYLGVLQYQFSDNICYIDSPIAKISDNDDISISDFVDIYTAIEVVKRCQKQTYLLGNIPHQIADRDQLLKKIFLQCLRYEKTVLVDKKTTKTDNNDNITSEKNDYITQEINNLSLEILQHDTDFPIIESVNDLNYVSILARS